MPSVPLSPRIIDAQAYVASPTCIPLEFIHDIAANAHLWLSAQGSTRSIGQVEETVGAHFSDPWCDTLIAQMDGAGISQAVLMQPDFTFALRSKVTIDEQVNQVIQVMKRHPGRFIGMLGVDPRWGQSSVDLFERSVEEDGFCGLKVYSPCGVAPNDRAWWPFFEICSALGLPVSVHIGGSASSLKLDATFPRLVDEPARAFPKTNFILSHGSSAYSAESIMLCASRPNVYMDVSGFPSAPMRGIRDALEHGLGHKLLFATDWPSFRGSGSLTALLERLTGRNGPVQLMRDFEVHRFFGGTLLSLLPERSSFDDRSGSFGEVTP